MPWRVTDPMLEKTRFVLAVEAEEGSFAELCAGFGIARETGYRWWRRYQEAVLAGRRNVAGDPGEALQPPLRMRSSCCFRRDSGNGCGGQPNSSIGCGRNTQKLAGPPIPQVIGFSSDTAWSSRASTLGRGWGLPRDRSAFRR